MIFKLMIVIFLFLKLINIINCSKILAIFPTPSKSHWILGSALMKELANSGHEVTVISPYPLKKNQIKNYRDIELTGMLEYFEPRIEEMHDRINDNKLKQCLMLFDTALDITNITLNHPNVQKLLNSNEQFDLIFLEIFLNDAILGLAHFYNAPLIGMSTVGPIKWINDMIGSPQPLSYIPFIFLPLTNQMTYVQRLINTFANTGEMIMMNLFFYHRQDKIYENVFGAFSAPKPTLDELRKNAVSLGLLNSHFSLSYPKPLLQNSIEVGGMHINRTTNPLPKNIEAFIESSKKGVIYFSLGSNLKPSKFPKEKMQIFYNVLSKLDYKILWKWDRTDYFEKSDNILISDWFPQNDILAHPKVHLFITHGGLLSCTESIYHGVPVVGIPMFADQAMNMAKAESGGWGLSINYLDLNEADFEKIVVEVLENPKYKEKVNEISIRYKDQPMTPMELAKFWVEYVIRHKGAPHLHSSGQDLNFIQYHMIDVFATIAFGLFLILFLIFKSFNLLINKIFRSKKIEKTIKITSKNGNKLKMK